MLNRAKAYIYNAVYAHYKKVQAKRMKNFRNKLTQSYLMVAGYQAILMDESKRHLLEFPIEDDKVSTEISRLEGIKKSLKLILEDVKETDIYLIDLI